jgi:hypothetical protein
MNLLPFFPLAKRLRLKKAQHDGDPPVDGSKPVSFIAGARTSVCIRAAAPGLGFRDEYPRDLFRNLDLLSITSDITGSGMDD